MTAAAPNLFAITDRGTAIPPASIIFGKSAVMSRLQEAMDAVAGLPVPILIRGETGTGKEVLAKYIHQGSPWKNGPFTKVRCATTPGPILEAELFGVDTGKPAAKPALMEIARSGTLLLDDISELDLRLQAKLLRLLQESTTTPGGRPEARHTSVRIICTSDRPLQKDAEEGRFDEGLLRCISGAVAALPALRDRIDDLPCIAEYLLNQFAESFCVGTGPLSPAIYRYLLSYHWPGNIRELENVLRRYSLLQTPSAILESLNIRPDAVACLRPN